jgi:uncharacterized protein
MNDELFDWDDANILHLAEHNVAPEEAEELMLGDPIEVGFEVIDGEDRWSYVGETNDGRILRVVIAIRGNRTRIVTAFKPSIRSRLLYLRKKAGEI